MDTQELSQRIGDYARERVTGRDVLLVVPDATRSGGRHVGACVRAVCAAVAGRATRVTALIALGTHKPMSAEKIETTFGVAAGELPGLSWVNHEWENPAALTCVGTLTRASMLDISAGKFDLADVRLPDGVPVDINARVPAADDVVIIGPVLPHEVVGISGGYKYFFPGVSGPRVTQVTHWLGALESIPHVIGRERTPVRRAIEHLAGMVRGPRKHCAALVVRGDELHDVYCGDPVEAHSLAAKRTREVNVRYTGRRYKTIVSIIDEKYPEIWTAGKGSYKLQCVAEDGGTILLYAPHLDRVSDSWGDQIARVGYHTMPYVQAHLAQFLDMNVPLGVLAHVTHVTGDGAMVGGAERPRVTVALASRMSAAECRAVNLVHVDPASVDLAAHRRDPDTLVVDHAGEVLYLVDP